MAHLLHPRTAWGYPTLPSGTRLARVIHTLRPAVYDAWWAIWEDGQQIASCTFTERGGPCSNEDHTESGLRDYNLRRAVPWAEVPAEVQAGILAQMAEWDASAGGA